MSAVSKAPWISCWRWPARIRSISPRSPSTALVEQYLHYISEAQRLKIEIAADYLVMAAWLAYLKSRLLLPREENKGDEPTAEEMAQRLAFPSHAPRRHAPCHGRADDAEAASAATCFHRGMPEGTKSIRETEWTAEIADLLKAYADLRRRTVRVSHVVKARTVWSIKQARSRLEHLVGESVGDWVELENCIKTYLASVEEDRTVLASSFGATLEMAREGMIELKQEAPFAPIYMRRCEAGAEWQLLEQG